MSAIKVAVISFLAGAAVVAVPMFLQNQSLTALRQENESLKQQAAQVPQLQDQLAKASQDVADAGGNAESQTRTLARLRAEVVELRKKTNELGKAQAEISSLNQQVLANAQEKAAMAQAIQTAQSMQADGQRAHTINDQNACINNLRIIDSAKQQWALEQRKTADDTPTWDDLRPYIGHGPNGDLPTCPSGGTYTIGTVREKPTCSVQGHALP